MISDLTYEDWILILEDDIKIMYSFDEFLYWIKKTLYRYHNADIIICGDRVGICGPVKTIDQINKFKKNKNYGLECYLVRCRSIDKFINELYLDREQNYCSIDNKIAELHSRKRINVVPLEAPSYGICIDKDQKDSDIEIENTIEDFWH
jgi:hypothetical protein